MTPTTLARIAGVLGGLCWPARVVADRANASEALVNGLHWGGLAQVAVALLLVAYCLAGLRRRRGEARAPRERTAGSHATW